MDIKDVQAQALQEFFKKLEGGLGQNTAQTLPTGTSVKTTQSNDAKAEYAQAVKQFLNLFNLSDAQLKIIRSIASLPNQIAQSNKSVSQDTRPALESTQLVSTLKTQAISEDQLIDPRKVEKFLASYDSKESLKTTLRTVNQLAQSNPDIRPNSRINLKLELVIKLVENILSRSTLAEATKAAGSDPAPIKKPVEGNPVQLQKLPPQNSRGTSIVIDSISGDDLALLQIRVNKILDALGRIAIQEREPSDPVERELVKIIESQLKPSPHKEQRLREIIRSTEQSSSPELLSQVLDSIDTSNFAQATGKERDALEFIIKLRDGLNKLLINSSAPAQLLSFLKESQTRLVEMFGADIQSQLFNPPALEETGALPRELVNVLRQINGQLQVVINELDTVVKLMPNQTSYPENIIRELEKLSKLLAKINPDQTWSAPNSDPNVFKSLVGNLKLAVEAGLSDKPDLAKLRTMLSRGLTELTQVSQEFGIKLNISGPGLVEVDSRPRDFGANIFDRLKILTQPVLESNSDLRVSGKTAEVLKNVERSIQNVIRLLEQNQTESVSGELAASTGAREESIKGANLGNLASPALVQGTRLTLEQELMSELKNLPATALIGRHQGDIKALVEILKQLVLEPPFTETQSDKEFVSLVRNLVRELESQTHKSDQAVREVLKRSLEQFKLFNTNDSASTFELTDLKSEINLTRQAENIIRGQEIISQINPLMRAIGEPILLLFPTFIQGMLAKLELTYYPLAEDYDPDEIEGDNLGDQRSFDSRGFERIHLSTSFHSLGGLSVDLAHRPGEVLINLIFESPAAAELVSSRTIWLQTALRSVGYQKVSINVESGLIIRKRPTWFEQITSGQLAQA